MGNCPLSPDPPVAAKSLFKFIVWPLVSGNMYNSKLCVDMHFYSEKMSGWVLLYCLTLRPCLEGPGVNTEFFSQFCAYMVHLF